MENSNERNLRRAEFLNKHRDIIASSAKYMELERERIAKAKRDAALAEQYLLNSNENGRDMKYRSLTREQHRLNKAARRAPRRAKNAMKKTVEIADGTSKSAGSSSRTVFKDVTGLQLVQETEEDVREFLQSIN